MSIVKENNINYKLMTCWVNNWIKVFKSKIEHT